MPLAWFPRMKLPLGTNRMSCKRLGSCRIESAPPRQPQGCAENTDLPGFTLSGNGAVCHGAPRTSSGILPLWLQIVPWEESPG